MDSKLKDLSPGWKTSTKARVWKMHMSYYSDDDDDDNDDDDRELTHISRRWQHKYDELMNFQLLGTEVHDLLTMAMSKSLLSSSSSSSCRRQ